MHYYQGYGSVSLGPLRIAGGAMLSAGRGMPRHDTIAAQIRQAEAEVDKLKQNVGRCRTEALEAENTRQLREAEARLELLRAGFDDWRTVAVHLLKRIEALEAGGPR